MSLLLHHDCRPVPCVVWSGELGVSKRCDAFLIREVEVRTEVA